MRPPRQVRRKSDSEMFMTADSVDHLIIVIQCGMLRFVSFSRKDHRFSFSSEDKTTRIFLGFAFSSAFGLCLDYDLLLMLMLMTILMSQT